MRRGPFSYSNTTLKKFRESNFLNILYEAYTNLNLDWLDNLFKELYDNKEKWKKSYFKSEFEKHNIFIDFDDCDDDWQGRNGLLEASYDWDKNDYGKGKLSLLFHPKCFLNFKNVGNMHNFISFKNEIKDSIIHEDTHRQHDVYDIKLHDKHYIQPAKPRNPGDPDNNPYFFQDNEVDAYARQYASLFYDLGGYTGSKIVNMLQTEEGFKELNDYLIHLGINGIFKRFYVWRKEYPKAWRRFLREIYDYFEIRDEF